MTAPYGFAGDDEMTEAEAKHDALAPGIPIRPGCACTPDTQCYAHAMYAKIQREKDQS